LNGRGADWSPSLTPSSPGTPKRRKQPNV
jgi:hypothetical protein